MFWLIIYTNMSIPKFETLYTIKNKKIYEWVIKINEIKKDTHYQLETHHGQKEGKKVVKPIAMPIIKEGGPDINDSEVISKYLEIDRWASETASFIMNTASAPINDLANKLKVNLESENEDGRDK